MDEPVHPVKQDRPNSPQAPDNVVVDPLRLRYNGELLFSACDHMVDGAQHLYNLAKDPVAARILQEANIVRDPNSPVKMLPNFRTVMRMCNDLSAQCELTPKDDPDPLLDPEIEFEDIDLSPYDPNSSFGGLSIAKWNLINAHGLLMHFSTQLLTWQQFGNLQSDNTAAAINTTLPPMATKLALECSQVPGCLGLSILAPYTAALFVPKLWQNRMDQVKREVKVTALRVIRQCTETRLREEANSKRTL